MLSKLLGIRIFDVEASSRCNVQCRFCPRDKLPETGLMSREVYSRLLNQLSPGTADTLSFVGIGEPLLNPLLPTFLMQAKVWHPNVRTWVTTNGTLLDEARLPDLLEARLDTLDISVNGTNAASYEAVVRGAKFEQVVSNVDRAVRLIEATHSPTRLQINFVFDGDRALEEGIKGFWRSRGVSRFRVQPLHSRAGAMPVPGGGADGARQADGPAGPDMRCEVFELFTFFTWRGDVLYCCNDLARRARLGNIGRDSWIGIARRKRAIARKGPWPAFCRQCTSPQRHSLFAYVDGQLRSELASQLRRGVATLLGRGERRTLPDLSPAPAAADSLFIGCRATAAAAKRSCDCAAKEG
jgi:organic radical activating enzyme